MSKIYRDSRATANELESLLTKATLGWLFSVSFFEEIDSTNSEAHRRVTRGEVKNSLIVAGSQSAGRGRRGRKWQSPAGSGVYMTLIWKFSGNAELLQGLSLAVGLAVTKALTNLGVSDLGLKWPNDVLFDQKKLAGILIELVPVEDGQIVIIGIGLNVALPPEVMQQLERPVVDTSTLTNNELTDCHGICAEVTNQLRVYLERYRELGFAAFQQQWNAQDAFAGTEVSVIQGNKTVLGIGRGVDEAGRFLLELNGEQIAFNGGELSPSVRKNER